MGYNQSNNPFSRKASPLNAKCPKGWTVNPDKDGPACLPPKKPQPEPQTGPDKKKEGPSRRSSSPLNQHAPPKEKPEQDCPTGWTKSKNGNCMPPKKKDEPGQMEPDPGPSRRSSSPLNQVEEQVYDHELSHDEIYEDPRSGENYLAQESYEKPGYDEYGGKIRGKKGRKTRKLGRIRDDISDITWRNLYEKTPNTISGKLDRKLTKLLKTKKQLKNI